MMYDDFLFHTRRSSISTYASLSNYNPQPYQQAGQHTRKRFHCSESQHAVYSHCGMTDIFTIHAPNKSLCLHRASTQTEKRVRGVLEVALTCNICM
jgi:hypothetical protein